MNNTDFTPHDHLCEIKMVKQNFWKKHCPYKGKISQEETECDFCKHLIVVEFEDNAMTIIKNIVRSKNE